MERIAVAGMAVGAPARFFITVPMGGTKEKLI
jgi:hypothetical protein